MESTLIVVTLLSLAMTAVMGSVAWRLLREERRRSAARVAALTALAARDSVPTRVALSVAEAEAPEPARRPQSVQVLPDLPLRGTPQDMTAPPADGRPVAGTPIFGAAVRPRGRSARPIIFTSVGFVMALSVLAAWYAGTHGRQASPAAPLELMSLGHDRQEDSLRITGLVQNPPAGREMHDVVAVAFLFDGDGTFIAGGRAPLDFARLAPGDESPFVIVVPNAGDVARYRLGFRTRDGQVLTHVDRRFDTSSVHRAGAAPYESAVAVGARSAVPESRK